MSQVADQTTVGTPVETDLTAEVPRVLAASAEPLTLSKIRSRLPVSFRRISLEELGESLKRQVAANVAYLYPRYRSPQDRYWDRPMPIHIAALLRQALQDGPLAFPELRRRLPAYALAQAESVLREQVAQGMLHRHPRGSKRGGERFSTQPADPKEFLRPELAAVLTRLAQLGFTESQLRAGALELLHDEEWSPAETMSPSEPPAQTRRDASNAVEQAETHSETPDGEPLNPNRSSV
jgi:hypothetical protein